MGWIKRLFDNNPENAVKQKNILLTNNSNRNKSENANEDISQEKLNNKMRKAVEGRQEDIVRECIIKGANVNDKSIIGGHTPLHDAVCIPKNRNVIELLITNGADINCRNNSGLTPLHSAVCRNDRKDNVRILLSYGADINIKDGENRTSLERASKVNAAIIRAGGETTYFDACESGNADKMIELLTSNCNTNETNSTLLFVAIQNNHKEIVELLISKGADVNTHDSDFYYYTPLYYAVDIENKEIIELLIAKGAAINDKNSLGQTALHKAVIKRNKEIARLLVLKGADINTKDSDGMTPVDIAKERRNIEMADLLISLHKDVNDKSQALIEPHKKLAPLDGSCILYFNNGEARDKAYRILSSIFIGCFQHLERRNVIDRNVQYKHWIVCDTKAYTVEMQDYLIKNNCECPESQHCDYWRVKQDSVTIEDEDKTNILAFDNITFIGEENVLSDRLTYTYRKYKAPNATIAQEFLKQNSVTQMLFYIIVETPEGKYCKDINGIYTQKQ